MQIVLYNPLCHNNSGYGKYVEFTKKLEKKKLEYKGFDLLQLEGKESEFLNSLNTKDIVTIIGGDGTLSRVVNAVKDIEVKNRVFFYKAGTGNDFARCYKSNYFEITDIFNKFPSFETANIKKKFLNGVGIGIDAAVCAKVNENSEKAIEQSYFKVAKKVFKNFKPFSIRLVVENKEYTFDKVWFAVVQNGRYFGGGMKIAPKADRKDDLLDIVVVHKMKLWKLLLVFPTIYFGKHTMFKKNVFTTKGKNILLEPMGYDKMQHDGEVIKDVDKIKVNF